MFDKFKKVFKKDLPEERNDPYVFVPETEINAELKRNIVQLERLADDLAKRLQTKYAKRFEDQGKLNLRIRVCRDIDGDEEETLTSERCLEKEYRSQIAIDYDGPKYDDEFDAGTLGLWYYFGGYVQGSGTLYDLSQNDLESDIEETLTNLLEA
ncbi:hypothetical protein [Planomicrobium sp. CPCC 101110]|uniref:hypothetical protein n=1 Tax=Planomicrobium sp. CPCC 101110 TaxID=2599619 RepID=UPI0011B3E78B|nr:hypothetical protein [Planomicrobium sp. CPCC 101110]TWT27193.1 hypothetical protein FQV30_01365 [Planomicrobium sp. CPCC 101110]